MPRRHDDPPDGLPPTCVEPTIGRVFAFHPVPHHGSALAVLPNGNGSNHPPPPGEQKCDFCNQPGVRPYDQNWACEDCGQKILDRLAEELERPAPRRIVKTILPGQRGRDRKRK